VPHPAALVCAIYSNEGKQVKIDDKSGNIHKAKACYNIKNEVYVLDKFFFHLA
jgi:hypothetical protein